jgi:hypothetical protein
MPNVTRITSNGTFYTANTIDEISYNPVAARKNLLTNSQDFNRGLWYTYCGNADLIKYNTPDIEAPDGTFTATKVVRDNTNVCGNLTPGWGFLYVPPNDKTFTYGKTYTVSVWARTNIGTLLFNLGGNDYLTVYNLVATTAWQRFTYTFVAVPNPTQGDRGIQFFTDTRNSTIYFWGAQLEEGPVATDYVRTDNSGVPISNFVFRTTQTGNYYAKSYIDEMSYNKNVPAKNLAFPADLSLWTKSFDFDLPTIATTNETLAPDGTNTAVKWTTIRNATWFCPPSLGTNPFKPGVQYTFSVYAKAGTASTFAILLYSVFFNPGAGNIAADFNVQTGTITGTNLVDSSRIIPVGDGWYRCSITVTCRISNNNFNHQFVRTAYANAFMYFWGYQIEEGAGPTDYVQTTNTGRIATNFVKRDTANGVSLVSSEFDERNGVLDQVVDSSLIVNLDAAKPESYPGSGTTWFDTTPNKLNATPGGATTPPTWEYITNSFAYRRGMAVQSLLLPTSPLLSTPSFTFELWVKQIDFNPNSFYTNVLLSREIYLTSGFRFGVASDGRPVFWTDQSGGNFLLASSIFTTLNRFYQVSVTYDVDQKICNMYVNGALAGTQRNAICLIPPVTVSAIALGAASAGGTNDQIGNIGNFMYYNRPLSASEVLQNYSAIRGRYGI